MCAYFNLFQRIFARIFFWNYAYSFLKKRKVQEILQEYFKIHLVENEIVMVMTDSVNTYLSKVYGIIHVDSDFDNKQLGKV